MMYTILTENSSTQEKMYNEMPQRDFIAPSYQMVLPKVENLEKQYINTFNEMNKADVLYTTLYGKIKKENENQLRHDFLGKKRELHRLEKIIDNCPCCNKCKRMNKWCSEMCARKADCWISMNSCIWHTF
jgi:hypothetical protein